MKEKYYINVTGPCISPFDTKEQAERFMNDLNELMNSYGVNPHWLVKIENEPSASWQTL